MERGLALFGTLNIYKETNMKGEDMTLLTKRTLLAVAVLGAIGVAAQIGRAVDYEVQALTPAELAASGALVVDIRATDEWSATGVIDGATLLTFTDPDSFLAAIAPDLADGRDLVLVCQSGRRSAAAAEAMAALVSNKVISLDGGMSAVIAGGYQTVAPN